MSRNASGEVPERVAKAVRWSREPEKQAWMEAHCGLGNVELSRAFEAEFGFPLSRPQITLWRQTNGRCLRESHGGGRSARPVGSEYVGKDGYVMRKVAERPSVPGSKDNWALKHVWAYEEARGPVPEGCNVFFADGNRRNFDPENLVAVPKRVVAVLNNRALGCEWHDADSLEACAAHAMLEVGIADVELSAPRRCRVCGCEFVPDEQPKSRRNTNVSTCRACLDAGRRARYSGDAGTGVCRVCGRPFRKSSPKNVRCSDCIAAKRWKPRSEGDDD